MTWPEPLLQPDPHKDCGFYATAYLARCLGFPTVTAEDVRRWREYTRKHESVFCRQALAVPVTTWNRDDDDEERRHYWLGEGQRPWVEGWLATHISTVVVHRADPIGHSVVALEATDDGVLLMDPLSGFVTESWDWFLSTGPGRGHHKCHHIEGWHPKGTLQ